MSLNHLQKLAQRGNDVQGHIRAHHKPMWNLTHYFTPKTKYLEYEIFMGGVDWEALMPS